MILTSPIHAVQTLILSTPGQPPIHYPDQTGTLDLLIKEAFSRINIDVLLKYYPPKIALTKANSGETDGDAVRIGGISNLYPNLLQVPAVAWQGNFVAFTKNPKIKLAGWQDLRPFNVAIIEGHKISEKMVTRTQSLSRAKNVESLFKLLGNDKVDIAICEQTFGFEMTRKLNMKDTIVIYPPLAKLLFYIYLHKKHEILIPGLIKALNNMQIDGTYTKMMNQAGTIQ